jgi:predicted GNAT family acetyltransferase
MPPGRSYQVVVSGHIGSTVAASLAPLTVNAQNGETTISGEGFDAAMLSGVLRTIERLGLELVAVCSFVDGERA